MIGWIFLIAVFIIEAVFIWALAEVFILSCLGYKHLWSAWALLIAVFGDAELKQRLRLIDKSKDPVLRLKRETAEWNEVHGPAFVEKDGTRFQLTKSQAKNLVEFDPTYKMVEAE